jgi:starvation-inducible outer membrane lipoprotein
VKDLLLGVLLLVSACATVPQNRRSTLADPIMQLELDSLDAHRKAKFYSTREAAAGGDGVPAGGGCGCQ